MDQKEINKSEWSDQSNWRSLLYNSQKDTRLFVPKRRGLGLTINIGHRHGKIVLLGLLLIPLIVFGILILCGVPLTKH